MTLTVMIDEAACAAHGDCVDMAPEVFVLDDVAESSGPVPTICCWRLRKRARAPDRDPRRGTGDRSIRDSVVALVAAVPVMPGRRAPPVEGAEERPMRAVLGEGGVAAAVAKRG